jgi:hypothetical protein
LSEQEIIEIEQHWQLQFPPDYRLFLKMLHSTNEKCVSFDEKGRKSGKNVYYNIKRFPSGENSSKYKQAEERFDEY